MSADCTTAHNPVACVAAEVRRISYCPDAKDHWRSLEADQCGDCEDMALTTGFRLLDLGFRPEDLTIIITRTWRGQCHAVLRVKDKLVDNGIVRGLSAYPVLREVSWNETALYVGRGGPGCPREGR